MCYICCCKSTIKYTFSEIKYIDKLYTMFQFIILGLLFLFIVLHFYTDIKNYINTGNIIEGNDEDATVPNADSDSSATTADSADSADSTTTADSATTQEPTDSNLKRGVCLGINTSGQDDA